MEYVADYSDVEGLYGVVRVDRRVSTVYLPWQDIANSSFMSHFGEIDTKAQFTRAALSTISRRFLGNLSLDKF